MGSEENVCPQAWGGRGAVLREVRRLAASPPPGIKLLLQEEDLTTLTAVVAGPADTPYAGGSFRVRLALGGGYPARPPRAVFETRIFHPNVSAAGEVCVSTLARDWRPELGLAHALVAVRALLLAPNPDSALNEDAATLLRDDHAAYLARARLYTDIHARAQPDTLTDTGTGTAATADPDTGADAAPKQEKEKAEERDGEGPSAKRERRGGGGGGAGGSRAGGGAGGRGAQERRRILKRL